MSGAFIESWIDDFIKERGKAAKETMNNEIYGWLIGYESKDGNVMVISAIACHRYNQQSVIGAQPDPMELQELGFALPVGVGFVGIYHSHPDEVFHSRTDNETLMTYARFYPKMLSAVTNGTDTKWYRCEGGTNFTEFEIQKSFVIGEQLQFVRAEARFAYKIAINPQKPAIPQISSAARAGFLAAWPVGTVEFLVLDEKKDKKTLDACELSPEDCVVAMAKTTGLKSLDKVPLSKIREKQLQYLNGGKTLARIELEMVPPKIEKAMLQVAGTIALDTNLAIITDSTAASHPFDMIREALVDDLAVKIGRGVFAFKNGQPTLIIAQSMSIPYIGIPLKLAMSDLASSKGTPDSMFNPVNFPMKSKFSEAEKQMFKSMSSRAFDLGLGSWEAVAYKMLENLKSIAKVHHQEDLAENCTDNIEALKSMNAK